MVIYYYFIASLYFDANFHRKLVHNVNLIIAISDFFIENESRLLNYFTIITYEVKFNYSLRRHIVRSYFVVYLPDIISYEKRNVVKYWIFLMFARAPYWRLSFISALPLRQISFEDGAILILLVNFYQQILYFANYLTHLVRGDWSFWKKMYIISKIRYRRHFRTDWRRLI